MIFFTLFLEFLKIGLFTFGGGYAMIPLVQETVLKHEWLTESQFSNFLGVCESTPGPIAINMATFVGSEQGGVLGSIFATLGVVLPSFIIILLIASILKRFTDNLYFKSFIKGIQPVITALIISAGLILLVKAIGYIDIKNFNFDYVPAIILLLIIAIFIGTKKFFKKKLSALYIIIISAALGIIVCLINEHI